MFNTYLVWICEYFSSYREPAYQWKVPGFHLPDNAVAFLMCWCMSPSVGFGTELLVSVLYWHRPDGGWGCGSVVLVERQDWTAPVGFSLGKKRHAVLTWSCDLSEEQTDFCTPLFCRCWALWVGLTRMDGHAQPLSWFLPHFLSNASTFSPIVRLSYVFHFLLFTIRRNIEHTTIDFCCLPSLSRALKVFLEAFIYEIFGERKASTNTSAARVQLLEDLAYQPKARGFFSL